MTDRAAPRVTRHVTPAVTARVTSLEYADDIDDVAVERYLAGRAVGRPLHPAEQIEVARIMRQRGATRSQIARALRINGRRAREVWEATA